MRLEIVNTCAEEIYLDKVVYGCYGDEGYLYNIHYHVNPENYNGRLQDWNGTIKNGRTVRIGRGLAPAANPHEYYVFATLCAWVLVPKNCHLTLF